MIRCLVDASKWNGNQIILPPEEEHHLLHVLRVQSGDTVMVFDGRGREASAQLLIAGRNCATLQIIKHHQAIRPALHLTLMQAIPKGHTMDSIVQKATELGVAEIVPILTERTVVRLTPNQRPAREDRWRRIAQSAAKQCGTPMLPAIKPISEFAEALAESAGCRFLLMATLEAKTEPLRAVIERAKCAGATTIAVLIGPEGDFSAREAGMAVAAGAVAVSLGSLVLRCETAALYAISVLNYEFGCLTAPEPVQGTLCCP